MEIEESPLWADIRKILDSGHKSIRFHYELTLHTVDHDMTIAKLVSIDIIRDYVQQIGDQINVEFLMPLGDYTKHFYPYRENLEVTVKRTEVPYYNRTGQDGDEPEDPAEIAGSVVVLGAEDQVEDEDEDPTEVTEDEEGQEEDRYKAVFLVQENKNIRASEYEHVDKFTLDATDIVTVKLQLIHRALEPMRIKTMGGVFQNANPAELTKAIMMGEFAKITIEGNPVLESFNMVRPDNSESRATIVIPHSTLVTAIPTYLQEFAGGIYNSGVGSYLQQYQEKSTLFVYPLFNTRRFSEDTKKAIFYAMPKNRYPAIENSFMEDGDIVHILATGNKAFESTGEAAFMDKGSGHRMLDARTIMAKPVNATQQGPVGIRTTINHEIVTKEREDNLNYAPVSHVPISSNPFSQASHTVLRTGGRIDLTWMHADPSLLYPGIPCQYLYVNDSNEVEEAQGCVVFVQVLVTVEGKGSVTSVHQTVAQVALYVEELPKPQNSSEYGHLFGSRSAVPEDDMDTGDQGETIA